MIIAVEVSRNAKDFNCKVCPHHHCDADGARPGSRGSASFPMWEIKGVIRSNVCLLPMVTAFSQECLALYGHYKNGFLFRSGGVFSQPNKYLKSMGAIDAANT